MSKGLQIWTEYCWRRGEAIYRLHCKWFTMQGKRHSCSPHISFIIKDDALLTLHLSSLSWVSQWKIALCLWSSFTRTVVCVLVVLRKISSLKNKKNGCGSMSVKSLEKIIKKFGETDSFEVKSGSERRINYFHTRRSCGYNRSGQVVVCKPTVHGSLLDL